MRTRTLLIAILVLAAILRLYHLGSYPALNADEAAIGYNAFSILQTGGDEHANSWPIHFQSFNDYKPGGLFYIVMPFVALFGLNEWSVRFPAALIGVLAVWSVYLLTKELWDLGKGSKITPLLAAAILAISPWHVHFSRGAWEVNVATFFITLGFYIFIKATKNIHLFVLAVLFFVLSIYTYHAARILVPVLATGLVVIYRKEIFRKSQLRLVLGSALLGLLLLVPLLGSLSEVGARASGVSILADRGYIDRINEMRGRHENPNSLLVKIMYNKPKEIALELGKNYLEHYWGEFLFISGDDIQRNKVPDFGQLYMWQFPVIVVGLFGVMKKPKGWEGLLLWLLIAPFPAALTFQSPHALRANNMVVPLTVLTAYGLTILWAFVKKYQKIGITALLVLAVTGVIVWDFSRYVHQYYTHMAKAYPYSSQYGVKELTKYLALQDDKKVIITTRYDQPYILFLFYNKYDPAKFQKEHVVSGRDQYGFSTVPSFSRYEFMKINYDEARETYKDAMIIGTDEEIIEGANVIKNIYGSNGFLYFQVVR